jgi:hypothetical protein
VANEWRSTCGEMRLAGMPATSACFLTSVVAERNQALLAPFADHAQDALAKIHLRRRDAHELAHAQARRIHELEHRAIAKADRCIRRRTQKAFDLRFGKRLGQAARQLRRIEQQRGIGCEPPIANHRAIEMPKA